MKEFINKNIKAIVVIILIITFSIIGFSLAYEANDIAVNIGSGNYNVVYTGSASIPSNKLQPIPDSELLNSDNSTKIMKIDFTVKGAESNPTTRPIIYDVSLTDLNLPKELKNKYLKWRLLKNGTPISEGNFSIGFDIIKDNRMVLTNIQQSLPSYSSTADSYTFYVWISEACTGDITTCTPDMDVSKLANKTFSGNIRIELSTGTPKALNRITAVLAYEKIMNLVTNEACAADASGVCATNSYATSQGTIAFHDYRYRGANVNNYVWFNNDMYRIIGVFDDYTHGKKGEYLVKLISANLLTANSWGVYNKADANGELNTYGGYANDWTGENGTATSKANLNVLLNEYFYNKTNISATYGACGNWTNYYNSGNYRTNDCSDIVGYGIDNNLQNYIEEVTWHIRGCSSNSLTKQNFYLCERGDYSGCTGANGSTTNVETTGKIGLMYVSDYLYATSYKSSTDTSITGSSYYNGNKNWLFKGYEWTMMPSSTKATSSFYVYSNGRVNLSYSFSGYAARPTFYLRSLVHITEGDGTIDNPYKLYIE